MKISIPIEIDLNSVSDLLVSAFEGGIGYWAYQLRVERASSYPVRNDEKDRGMPPEQVSTWLRYEAPFGPGGAVILYAHDELPDNVYPRDVKEDGTFVNDDDAGRVNELRIDMPAIEKGLKVMAEKHPRHFADFIGDNADATTGDVFIQCVVFGELVYG